MEKKWLAGQSEAIVTKRLDGRRKVLSTAVSENKKERKQKKYPR